MTILVHQLRNLRLGFKLNLVLVLMLIVLLVAILLVIYSTVLNFTAQSGEQRVDQEMDLVGKRIAEQERDLLQTVALLVVRPGIREDLNQTNVEGLSVVTAAGASQLSLDSVQVVNANGDSILLVTNGVSQIVTPSTAGSSNAASKDEGKFLTLGLSGMRPVGVVNSTSAGGDQTVMVAAALPLQSPDIDSKIIGALLGSRAIDSKMLNQVDFGRSDVHIALIEQGKIVSRDDVLPQTINDSQVLNGIAIDPSLVNKALAGKPISLRDLSYAADHTPVSIGYMPFTINNQVAGVLVVQVRMDQIVSFGNQLAAILVAILALLAALVLGGVSILTRQLITRPLDRLRSIAALMQKGDYNQRVQVRSVDEIGQLGTAFNEMSATIQNRQTELEHVNTTLEQRVKDRTVDLEEAKYEAERANLVKSSFLASMSHELRTPLNAIINFTAFVVDGLTGPVNELQQETLNEVLDSSKHLLGLINDVLDMSKIEAGALVLFIEDDVDLTTILNSAMKSAKGLLAKSDVALEMAIDGTLPLTSADRQRVYQIVLNILSNACKFTKKGFIKLSARHTVDDIIISIQDTGPGIAAGDQSHVFEAFKQTKTGLRQGGGTGLGMPISKSLAEAHGGKLWLESEPGKGTTFFVSLPLKSAPIATAAALGVTS